MPIAVEAKRDAIVPEPKAVERAQEEGLEVVGIVTLVDREEGAREAIEGAGQILRTVFTKSEVVG